MAIVTIEQAPGTDGFFNPLRIEIRSGGPFATKLGLVDIMTRSAAPNETAPITNRSAGQRSMKEFPRQCPVVVGQDEDPLDPAKLYTILQNIAEFLNDEDRKQRTPMQSPSREQWEARKDANKKRYVVPTDWNTSPRNTDLCKLGDYIVTDHVVNFIRSSYNNVCSHWARDNPTEARKYFNAPFPVHAITTLGYTQAV